MKHSTRGRGCGSVRVETNKNGEGWTQSKRKSGFDHERGESCPQDFIFACISHLITFMQLDEELLK